MGQKKGCFLVWLLFAYSTSFFVVASEQLPASLPTSIIDKIERAFLQGEASGLSGVARRTKTGDVGEDQEEASDQQVQSHATSIVPSVFEKSNEESGYYGTVATVVKMLFGNVIVLLRFARTIFGKQTIKNKKSLE